MLVFKIFKSVQGYKMETEDFYSCFFRQIWRETFILSKPFRYYPHNQEWDR